MKQLPQALPHSADSGYAAIISIIITLVVIVLVGTTTSLVGIGNAQMSLGHNFSETSLSLIETCIEDALLTYNNTGSIPTTITNPLGSCTTNTTTVTANTITFTTTTTLHNHTHTISTSASRETNVTVVSQTQIN